MIYGMETDDEHAATGALLVYATYRSRDTARFKVTPDMWGLIERSVKASAKRATTLPRFLETLKPKIACSTLSPKWMEAGIAGTLTLTPVAGGGFVALNDTGERREFLASPINDADAPAVLDALYRETAYVVLLVRDRLEREKSVEARFAKAVVTLEEDAPWMPA